MGLTSAGRAARMRSRSEFVEVGDDGAEPVPLSVYARTGKSQRTRTGDLLLYAGLQAPVWKDESHVAYLRHPDGRIIDMMRAGRPPRRVGPHLRPAERRETGTP